MEEIGLGEETWTHKVDPSCQELRLALSRHMNNMDTKLFHRQRVGKEKRYNEKKTEVILSHFWDVSPQLVVNRHPLRESNT